MTNLEIIHALSALRPGASWSWNSDNYADLNWMDTTQKAPTLDEISAYLASVSYVPLRVAAYPPIGDQLDAIWKAFTTMNIQQPDAQAMLAQIQAVKAKYPKPQS